MATNQNKSESKSTANPSFQEFKVKGSQLLDKVKEVIEEGNARRVIIRNADRTLLEIPLALGVGGAAAAVLLMPALVAIGALAALIAEVSVIVERDTDGDGVADESATLLDLGKKGGAKSGDGGSTAGTGKTMGNEAK